MKKFAFFALAVVLCGSTTHAAEQGSAKPPKELSALAKAPWVVEVFAYGDLTGKKTKDAAIIFAVNPDGSTADQRKLVVALRGTDGNLHVAAQGLKCVPTGSGPAGGEPELSIKRNSVYFSQFGGSREKGTDIYQYKQIGNEWRLIGYNSQWYDSLSESLPTTLTDVNFLTNYAEASLSQNDKATQTMKLYQVPSLLGAPPKNGPWQSPAVVLKTKQAIEKGEQAWTGPQDLSASIRSYHDGDTTLNIQVEVTDDEVTAGDTAALFDEKGHEVHPTSQSRSSNPGGYRQTMEFDLTTAPFTDHVFPRDSVKNVRQLPYTIRVTDSDKPGKATIVMSTALSASGTAKHGSLLMMPTKAPYSMSNVDVQDGAIQYPIIDLPEH